MSSPLLYGPNNTALNLQNGSVLANGPLLKNDGPKNYIGFNNFENGLTTGWSLGTTGALTNAIPTGTPTFGSGTTNLALGTTTSNPISGTTSLQLTASAATTAGNMLATDALAIDIQDQAKVLTFQVPYTIASGVTNLNFSGTLSNSFGIACWDVTNSSWLPVAGNFSMTQNSGSGLATGTFQTNITTASVRFMIYAANASAGAATLNFDTFFLGPQTAPIGPVVTDPVSWTPTFTGWGTVTSINATSWRNGAFLEGVVTFTAGTATAVEAQMTLGFQGGNSNVTTVSTLPTLAVVGKMKGGTGSTTFFAGAAITAEASKTYLTFSIENSTTSGLSKSLGNAFTSTVAYSFTFKVQIAGWSSNVQTSNDTDTRVVVANYLIASNVSASTVLPIDFATKVIDTHAAVTTGAAWKFTAPITGFYGVGCSVGTTGAVVEVNIFKNGTVGNLLFDTVSTGYGGGYSVVQLNAGDFIDLRPAAVRTMNGQVQGCNVSIMRLSGPAVIAATESVNARYFASATAITGSLATVVWTTKDFDSHNAMASGLYTIPVSGKYEVNLNVQVTGTIALNSAIDAQLQKNTVAISEFQSYAGGAMTAQNAQLSDIISCNAGDVIRLQLSSSATLPVIAASNTKVFFSISRVGN